MTKDVLVSVIGHQYDNGEEEEIEVISPGVFYRKNDKVYIKYEESIEGYDKKINSMIKVDGNRVEITKKGVINTNMVFVLGEKIVTSYESPFGIVSMGINTENLTVFETDTLYRIELNYDMEFNGQFVNKSKVLIRVMPKGADTFKLMDERQTDEDMV